MSVPASIFPELEQLVQFSSAQHRAETLRRLTTLFLDCAANLNDDHVALFDDVMCYLMEGLQYDILAELARRLAPIPNAPAGVISKLASNDDIEIAKPVLEHAHFTDRDLLKVAETMSQAHLLVLSSRSNIDEMLSKILITRGNRDVILSLVNNVKASLSENAFIRLVKKAEDDPVLAEKLLIRRDIPPRFFRELWMQARGTGSATQAENQRTPSLASNHSLSPGHSLNAGLELAEAEIAAFAKAGKHEETIAALATVCPVRLDVINRLMSGNRLDPLLILGRAAGFGWATVSALIGARPGLKPTDQVLSDASDYYYHLTPAAAERVVRFWQARSHR